MAQQSNDAMTILRNGEKSSAIDRAMSFLAEPLIKPQALRNRHAALILEILKTIDVPYREYPSAIESANKQWNDRDDLALPYVFYNPIGKLIFRVASWDLDDYANRVRDLEGLRRISLLTAKLHSTPVAAQDVPGALQTIGINDPYSEKPFEWDNNSQSVVFQGLEKKERGRHLVMY